MMKLEYLGEHPNPGTSFRIPYFPGAVPAGFPSPADDYMDGKLDLNEHLIRHPAATFYCRVSGSSMEGAGIFDGDLLVVDRAVEPEHGSIVVAVVDGEMTCKILDRVRGRLLSANVSAPSIKVPGSPF
ncbi:MAG: translesion error-prone DNA polymerase V autoproteolytic subunit [Gammaproteobacteria bacterium]|nr:translesion error-prone DNA polymerase V autoproteolytic subunit [Gammaproteobacteria bacterium]MYG68378.1 translesion error-prone DNA polymerase V autoproteolytic subunit [Gammaproteobacteria bacterium]